MVADSPHRPLIRANGPADRDPGRELALAKRGGAEHTLIDFVGEIKDLTTGTTVTDVRDNVNIKLSDATAAELAHRPIEYDTGFTLMPGNYVLKFLARDDETGRIGTCETTFIIFNLNREEKHVPISSVVLSSQRVSRDGALFDAAKSKDRTGEEAVNPLVQDGRKLIPSVTRVFATTHEMYVCLQAYKQSPEGTQPSRQPLFAFMSLYKDDAKVFETPPAAVVPSSASRLGTMPLNFSVDINGLAGGKYDRQVTVLDPDTLKANILASADPSCSLTGSGILAAARKPGLSEHSAFGIDLF